ncbi:hypothetical protein BN1708_019254, partial [Verticillium longisporum]
AGSSCSSDAPRRSSVVSSVRPACTKTVLRPGKDAFERHSSDHHHRPRTHRSFTLFDWHHPHLCLVLPVQATEDYSQSVHSLRIGRQHWRQHCVPHWLRWYPHRRGFRVVPGSGLHAG